MSTSSVDKEYSLEAVPKSQRSSFWHILVVMLGFTFFSASMWSGGQLGTGLTFTQFVLAVLAGNLILGIYTGALAYMAADTGLSTHLLARFAFGEKGSYLASFMLAATQIGWFGVGVAMFALPVNKVTGIDTLLLIVVFGIVMTATVYFGIKALAILSFIACPSIAVLGMISVTDAANSVGGLQGTFAISTGASDFHGDSPDDLRRVFHQRRNADAGLYPLCQLQAKQRDRDCDRLFHRQLADVLLRGDRGHRDGTVRCF